MKNIRFYLILMALVGMVSCNQKKEVKRSDEPVQQEDDSIFIKANGKLTPEIMWKFGRVSGISLSPDNKSVVYGVSRYNLKENKGNRDLFKIDIENKEVTQLTTFDGPEFNCIWRPDGEKIGFISSKDGSAQIYEMDIDGQNVQQVSDIKGGINGFEYAPGLKHLLFVSDVKLDQTPTELYPDLPEANVHIINGLMYRHWDQWHDYTYSHIFVATYENGEMGEAIDIMENEKFNSPMKPWGGMEQIAWAPSGKKIAYTCKKLTGKAYTLSTNSEIYIYDLESGETTNLTRNGFEGYDHDPVFSPDGKFLVFGSMEEDGFESDKDRIILYDFETGEFKDLSENFDQSSSHFTWAENSEGIYFISGYHATYQLYYLELATLKIKQITDGWHNYQEIALGDGFITGTKMSMSMPTEIFKVNIKTGNETQLTFTNKVIFNNIKMGEVKKRWIETTDHKQMLTWIIYPPGFDSTKQYPALLYCQGGPQSAVSQFFSYRWNFQIMAANGYIIVAPNRRGLPTFGQEWNDQISGDYGGQNMLDYFSAIDEMAKESYIDENRLGAVGASYGGYSIFWLAGHHEGRFKAFISHCGIFNFESMYGSTEEYWFVNKDMEGPYWETPKPKSYEFSPHLAVQNWDTPILIISGEHDFRIPYTQSLEAFDAAQLLGVESKLLIFPDESHFVTQPQNAVLWQREFFGWLDQHLK